MQKIEDKDNKEVSINVRVNDKDKRIFYQICEQMGMTPSKVVRKLLEEFCENNAGKKNLLCENKNQTNISGERAPV